MPTAPKMVTRFAPSPTGHLHVGGARTAMFCWALARSMGGSFLLRIEDTDAARSSDESARGIMADLAWLGLDWDQGPTLAYNGRTLGGDPHGVGPFFQARRVETQYNPAIERLVEEGKAYPAFESSEELEAARSKAVAAKQTYRYDRASFHAVPDVHERLRRMRSGEPHVVRLLAPREAIVVEDQVLGNVKVAAGELDDFVLRKGDGFPTYHFAVVVDDASMGITHVLRAQEHLINTPRHVALQRALGVPTPVYAHVPVIANLDGSKMSKRDKAKAARKALESALAGGVTIEAIAMRTAINPSELQAFLKADNDAMSTAQALGSALHVALPEIEVADFRAAGYTPQALCNFLALLGWNPGMKSPDGKDLEKFDLAFLAQHFSFTRIGKAASKFDRKKLASFNGDALSAMTTHDYRAAWQEWAREHAPDAATALIALTPEQAGVLVEAIKPRAKIWSEATSAASFAFARPASFDNAAMDKHVRGASTLLRSFRDALAQQVRFDAPALHERIESFVREHALPNTGPIAQAVRVALTGKPVSPSLDATIAVLGKNETLARIDACLRAL